jgi:hypothetical protein
MGIVPMHEWKMPLKYWGMIPSLSGPLGLQQSGGHHGQGGVPSKVVGTKFYLGIQYILRRNSVREPLSHHTKL